MSRIIVQTPVVGVTAQVGFNGQAGIMPNTANSLPPPLIKRTNDDNNKMCFTAIISGQLARLVLDLDITH